MKHIVGKLKQKIAEHKTEIFIVLLIFVLAFGARAYLMRFELPFEFDPYWHARMVSYIIQTGNVPTLDPLSYWNYPGGMYVDQSSIFFWQLAVIAYGIITLGSSVYSKDAIILVMKILPALFGALAAVGAYFLVKEIYGRKPAIAAGVLAAVMPAFVYRTMSGFFEPTSIGFMWIVFGLYFLAKAGNNSGNLRNELVYGFLSGLMLGLLALSWKGFLFTVPIFIASSILIALNIFSKKSFTDFRNFMAFFAVAVGVFVSLGWLSLKTAMIDIPIDIISTFSRNLFGENFLLPIAGIAAAIVILVLALTYLLKSKENFQLRAVVSYLRLFLIIAMIAVMLYAITSGKDFSSSGVIGSSIGEESHGNLFFGNKYNLLLFFFAAALAIIPIKDFFDRKDINSPIIITLAVVTFFLAWTKLKFTFLFGLPLALSAAPLFWLVLSSEKIKIRAFKKIAAVFLGFCLLVGVAAGTFFVSQQFPNIEMNTGWKEALKWVSVNTPKNAKMFNWWDEGHWIAFIGERAPIIDNRNADGDSRQKVSLFLSTQDINEAESIIKETKPDYLLLGDDLLEKQTSLAQYAFNSFNDPRIKQTFGISFDCSKNTEPVSGTITYSCQGNNLTAAQMNSLPTKWVLQPNNLLNERMPVFIYRNEKSDKISILNTEANNTFLAKVWFHEPSVYDNHFEELYSFKQVKVFKVLN